MARIFVVGTGATTGDCAETKAEETTPRERVLRKGMRIGASNE
jgi:hypothetical protein